MPGMIPAPVKPEISFGDLQKIDIRVGTIRAVEDVQASDKLVRLRADFGDHTRTILADLKKERENPQDIEGVQALFVVNIKPRRMAGETSEGMLFDLGFEDDVAPALAVPERPIPNGAQAG
jgi:tRNA-binding protein